MLDPELRSYIEYLQRQGTDPDFAGAFDQTRLIDWIKSNPPSMQRLYELYFRGDQAMIERYVRGVEQFIPYFARDTFHSSAVFASVLHEVEVACTALNVSPVRPVILASSAEIGLSPLARPSTGEHVLFAGHGTMAFCNYWAKAYSWLLFDFSQQCRPLLLDQADLSALAKEFPGPLVLMARLLLHYAYSGTFLAFGEVTVRTEHEGLRLELLHSMEIFAIGHEIGHFVMEELRPSQGSSLDPDDAHAIELFCDQYGQAVSRWHGAANTDWSCFVTSGALLYLHAGSLCLRLRKKIRNESEEDVDSRTHPRTWNRIDRAVKNAVACVPADQVETVQNFLNEIVAVLRFIEDELFPIVIAAIQEVQEVNNGLEIDQPHACVRPQL